MQKFTRLTGVAAPLFRANVDTDAIIPSREMKKVSKEGLGEGMFADWRYSDVANRVENPEFILNWPCFRKAPILLAGPNFGCGSSREHAVWALQDYGIRCVIAPSFGAIFQGNCVRNGILPLVLPEPSVAALAQAGTPQLLTVDLAAQSVRVPDGTELPFTIAPADKEMLLEGLDAIGVTLKRLPAIRDFEGSYRARNPWLFF
ncbi:3-isopropylmalate dehydratase small subunit [Niveispirillum cyanobacteriorum]|uniref:3-isopropylmalate dehydratase small subunit n=1 Tax=Niveispirillum cyanobacteriorum TaxID=1612173 RepID=A0A2K9NIF4_9PROT|nr:3-isopropylmalate dehydratase small subunit [Niveispirillum cyanobacteriorum]AUN32366.1 3-isopropylmalate dehydratase small subunit [Niveispirillum cyanobacteriorum]GGE79018.1 3-isopropylmalate dehydratase small subunit [Niveispirillum cyanobacteriorum]